MKINEDTNPTKIEEVIDKNHKILLLKQEEIKRLKKNNA